MKRLMVLLGVAGVSLSAILVRCSTAPSMVLVFYRVFFAACLLAPAVWKNHRDELRSLPLKEAALSVVSGVFLGFHFSVYFESLRYTSIASAVVLVDTEVFFVALGSLLFLKKKICGKAWLAICLTFAGSVAVAMADSAAGGDALRGDLLALTGALLMAVYTVIGAAVRKSVSTTVYTFLLYLSAALTAAVVTAVQRVPLAGHGALNYLTALAMAVFCTLLGHSVFSWGLKYLPPAFISTVKLLEPVFASVWGLLLFGEVPPLAVALGGGVIIAGIALYSRVAAQESNEE